MWTSRPFMKTFGVKGALRTSCALGGIVLATVGVFGGRWLYERQHLSDGLQRLLDIDTSSDMAPAEVKGALQAARGEVHTRRDHLEYLKLQRALELGVAADGADTQIAERQRENSRRLAGEIHSEHLMQLTQQIYLAEHVELSTRLGDDIAQELEKRERLEAAETRAAEQAQLLSLDARLESKVLRQEIRHDLGR